MPEGPQPLGRCQAPRGRIWDKSPRALPGTPFSPPCREMERVITETWRVAASTPQVFLSLCTSSNHPVTGPWSVEGVTWFPH